MKSFWKVLGAAALVAGLAPYKVEKDEETGKTSYQSLLMRITTSRGESEKKKQIAVDLGEGTLFQKAREKAVAREEAHLFTDDLAVAYQPAEAEVDDMEDADAEIEAMAAEAKAVADEGKAVIAEAKSSIAEAEAEIDAMAADEEAAAADAEAPGADEAQP